MSLRSDKARDFFFFNFFFLVHFIYTEGGHRKTWFRFSSPPSRHVTVWVRGYSVLYNVLWCMNFMLTKIVFGYNDT